MMDLYTWKTPNGRKPAIMLEELGLSWRAHPIDISKGEQFAPEFLAISPNNRIPALVDQDAPGGPVSVFESGAILIYLAEKEGRFLPSGGQARVDVLQWLMWQMGGVGPMFGQAYHFAIAASERVPYGIERYLKESRRLLDVLDRALAKAPYMAGEYSIADMATYPWVSAMLPRFRELQPSQFEGLPHVEAWLDRVGQRPAVQRGMRVLEG